MTCTNHWRQRGRAQNKTGISDAALAVGGNGGALASMGPDESGDCSGIVE